MNPMNVPRIAKIVINIGVGEGGTRLTNAEKVLELLTGEKPQRTYGRIQNRDLKVREGAPIGCKSHNEKPREISQFLKDAIWVRQGTIPAWNFDQSGNLSFGISDYTDFLGKNMTQTLEFTEWMLTSSSRDLDTEFLAEEEQSKSWHWSQSNQAELWLGYRRISKFQLWRSENGKRSRRENWKINRMQKMRKKKSDQETWIANLQTMFQRQGRRNWFQEIELRRYQECKQIP